MMDKVRFAVVGVRSIGNAYVNNAIKKLPEAELITICDNDPEILAAAFCISDGPLRKFYSRTMVWKYVLKTGRPFLSQDSRMSN